MCFFCLAGISLFVNIGDWNDVATTSLVALSGSRMNIGYKGGGWSRGKEKEKKKDIYVISIKK